MDKIKEIADRADILPGELSAVFLDKLSPVAREYGQNCHCVSFLYRQEERAT